MIKPGDWFVKVDLRHAYFCVLVHALFRKYLQFSVGGKIYQFRGWPNGLSEAPRLLTNLLKPVLVILKTHVPYIILCILVLLIMIKTSKDQHSFS